MGTELEGCCKFHVWVTDGDVTVKAAIKGDKVVSFTSPFGEIYDKVPKIRRAVEAMNDMVEDFGVGTLPQKPDLLDSVWMYEFRDDQVNNRTLKKYGKHQR